MALLATNLASASFIVKEKTHVRREGLDRAHHLAALVRPAHTPAPIYFKDANELQTCYAQLLASEPAVDEGSLLVNSKVNREGSVENLQMVESDFEEPQFTQCVLDKIQSTRLPASAEDSGTFVAHRFRFHRKSVARMDF